MTNSFDVFDLSGKVALVTGASRGIGEEVAKILAAHGATVIVSSRKADACEAVVAAIKAVGGKAEARACHIGEMAQIDALFADIAATHGRLDILVNNAATNPHFGHITETDLGAFQKTVDVNIRGYFFMSSAGVKLMAKNGGGSIINVASALFHNPAILEKALNRIPMKRIAEPSEMAGTVLYLASAAASYTTGACINVDGGYLLS